MAAARAGAELRDLYFDRALSREEQGDLAGAYADYQTAAALDPQWEPPRLELQRFRIEASEDNGA